MLPDDFDQQINGFEQKLNKGEVSQYSVHSLLELYNQAIEHHVKRNEKSDVEAYNVKIQ